MAERSRYGTGFTESDAILAAQAGDAEALYDLVGGMLPNERRELARAAEVLHDVLWDETGRPGNWEFDTTPMRRLVDQYRTGTAPTPTET